MTSEAVIAVVGRACRLPGAASVEAFWRLLRQGRCAVSRIPADRWALERLHHPREHERGRSYTWAAGVLDDVWAFEPAVFGLSPREADQMDPQQRLLLELAYEAFEDAGLRPSRLAGSETGVFVGASSTEYGNLRVLDGASSDAYTATGNALSIASNRISYAFDLRGPSLTVDTACSSSLVALNEAVGAMRAGRIDTAVVAGVNVLANSSAFVSFSQAGMLSRTGLCQAFSAEADGYVRSEGGVVLVLRTLAAARAAGDRIHGLVLASDVNSDGRTSGISLPSRRAQATLIRSLYGRAGVQPDDVAFIEAHGTGTPVGDPIEAGAIGEALGQARGAVLPVGSVKTNIGHTEPAAGLAGMLKAMLALEHDYLPASLHCATVNPAIPFADLNLAVCSGGMALSPGTARVAGVNSFGFGGTNAHVILADAPPTDAPAPAGGGDTLVISASSRQALGELAGRYAERLAGRTVPEARRIADAAFHRRDTLATRLVVPVDDVAEAVAALSAVEAGGEDPRVSVGTSVAAAERRVAFVYSGNGSQWVGMGRAAYAASAAFRARFDEIDRRYRSAFGWSPIESIQAADLADHLSLTSVAQPLIFALQAASTFALAERGLVPDMVTGHSVGEIAAAEAAGVLDLDSAIAVIHHRSRNQETTRHLGRMAVIAAGAEQLASILAAYPALDIAAFNANRAFTLAGPSAEIDALVSAYGAAPHNARRLDLDYPFHSRLMDGMEGAIRHDLAALRPKAGAVPIISTVTGTVLDGAAFDAGYWWRNIREPIRFREAIGSAMTAGARVVVEIGPRPMLLRYIGECFGDTPHAAFGVHDRKPVPGDPIRRAVAKAVVRGASPSQALFGTDPGPAVDLPATPWCRTTHRLERSQEASVFSDPQPLHPLVGSRPSADALTWTASLDTAVLPGFADHRVGRQVLLPGSGFLEMAITAARQWLPSDTPAVRGFEILQPLVLSDSALRDVVVRVTPGIRLVEILSRRRLTAGPWQLHARAKIVEGASAGPGPAPVVEGAAGLRMSADALYILADQAGLQYGPAFRLATAAARHGTRFIVVDLDDAPSDPAYALDPMRLDACFHGLALIFSDLSGGDLVRPFIPVRFEEVRVVQPGATPARAVIEVLRMSDRSIVADFSVQDAAGAVVAEIRRAQFHPMRLRRTDELARHTILQRLVPATPPTASRHGDTPALMALFADAASRIAPGEGRVALSPSAMLLEGWATAKGYEIARGLAKDDVVDPRAAAAGGRIGRGHVPWLANLLMALEASGLATGDGGAWRLHDGSALPRASEVLRLLAADHPDLAVELPLAAHVGTYGADAAVDVGFAPSATAVDAVELRGAFVRQASETLLGLLSHVQGRLADGRVLRVLQIGAGPPARGLASFAQARHIVLTVLETDRRRLERAKVALPAGVACVADVDGEAADRFDLVVASDGLHRLTPELLRAAVKRLAPDGVLVAVEPSPSLFRDLVFGLRDGWFVESLDPLLPVGALPADAEWVRRLSGLGLSVDPLRPLAFAGGDARLILASAPTGARRADQDRVVTIVGDDGGAAEPMMTLATLLAARGAHVSTSLDSHGPDVDDLASGPVTAARETVVFLAQAFKRGGTAAERVAERCLALKRSAMRRVGRDATVWVVCPGATRPEGEAVGPVQAAVWAFARTLANEMPTLDVRRVDVPIAFGADVAGRLCDLVLGQTDETEILIDAERTSVVRIGGVELFGRPERPAAEAAVLDQRTPGILDGLAWAAADRAAPAAGQVELAVEATGLNFRDVLFALSMLPDDILEDGFSGPGMGLECAGRVLRVGTGVSHVAPGDRVVAFAKSGFGTHVTVPGALVAPAPAGLSAEAAATIPVAFMTAYHGLVTMARLRRRESVLIHGAAGGVGLAAIQIAKRRGAVVMATAGSPDRRALALALGADHAFDSRSLTFVDDVRAVSTAGVDVVLNSLAGEAMEESLGLLKPFGRFVELGKRDYVANTHVGLRPFRRNLSYFGVDLDQLLLGQAGVGRRLLRDVMALFRRGALKPLPFERFAADEVSDAFRLMQQSGHVGKIVVTPPAPGMVPAPSRPRFDVDPAGTHLVTGAFGGFGAEAVRWLADKGARHFLLLGRRGAEGEAAQTLVDDLIRRGASVAAPACDVTDRDALEAALATPGLPPLSGVIHAAMVLDDGLVANLDRARLDRVLGPKIAGADLLDELTRAAKLDYFVLFSSATTLVGNPGQGGYVAANAYLEAVARRRRRAGLPALAVAWGAIADVGVLTRQAGVKDRLAALIGIDAMKAREALDLMGAALARQGPSPEDAVIGLASVNWGQARDRLPVLRSPTYAGAASDLPAETQPSDVIDIAALAAGGHDAARLRIADAIADEVARILRLPRSDVAQGRPLSDLGFDSLMGVELASALQGRFILSAAPSDLASSQTILELADLLLGGVDGPTDGHDGVALAARRHLEDAAAIEAVALLADEQKTLRLGSP